MEAYIALGYAEGLWRCVVRITNLLRVALFAYQLTLTELLQSSTDCNICEGQSAGPADRGSQVSSSCCHRTLNTANCQHVSPYLEQWVQAVLARIKVCCSPGIHRNI